jgi:hypothetical protein
MNYKPFAGASYLFERPSLNVPGLAHHTTSAAGNEWRFLLRPTSQHPIKSTAGAAPGTKNEFANQKPNLGF